MIADKLVCPRCKRTVDLSIYGNKFDILTVDDIDMHPNIDRITVRPICNFTFECATSFMTRCNNETLPLVKKLAFHQAFDISVIPADLSTEYMETIFNPIITFKIRSDRTYAINTLMQLENKYPNIEVYCLGDPKLSPFDIDINIYTFSIRIKYKYDYENAIPFEDVNIIGSLYEYNKEYFQFIKDLERALV